MNRKATSLGDNTCITKAGIKNLGMRPVERCGVRFADENVLLAANQNTDTVVTFRIHPRTGALKATGHVADVPTPVCVKIVHLT